MTSVRASAFGIAILVCSASGCDDLSPLDYVAPAIDAHVPEVVDSAAVSACRSCIHAMCGEPYAACATEPKCPDLIECITATDCFRQVDLAQLTLLPECATSCIANAGIVSLADPTLLVAAGMFQCVAGVDQCGPACTD